MNKIKMRWLVWRKSTLNRIQDDNRIKIRKLKFFNMNNWKKERKKIENKNEKMKTVENSLEFALTIIRLNT